MATVRFNSSSFPKWIAFCRIQNCAFYFGVSWKPDAFVPNTGDIFLIISGFFIAMYFCNGTDIIKLGY